MNDQFPGETAMPTELEHDLTELLHQRATQVAVDSEAAFTEHRRRLRASNTRRRAALALGLLAVVAGPTLLFVHHPKPNQSAAAPSITVTRTTTAAAPTYPTFRIADFSAQGKTWVVWVILKENCLNIQAAPAGQPADGSQQYVGGDIACPLTVQDPTKPLILQSGVLDQGSDGNDMVNSSPLPDLSVWVTTANVARLDITLADKQTISARLIGRSGGLKLFLSDRSIMYYRADTYYDAAGNQIYRDTTSFDK